MLREATHVMMYLSSTFDDIIVRPSLVSVLDDVISDEGGGDGTEMFDNPLYAAMAIQQEPPRWDPPTPPPDGPGAPPPDGELERPPRPTPTPRNRSFTCSEGKPPPLPARPAPSSKRPVVPPRSEGGVVLTAPRPPLPVKRAGLLEPQPLLKPPREHARTPARPSQSLPSNKQ